MSVSSVGSSNPYSYLQKLLQSEGSDPTDAAAPSDPLQALYQSFTGGSSSDPLISSLSSDEDGSGSSGSPQFSPDVMQALFSIQGSQPGSSPPNLQSLIDKFDANGDGQISQSEFESAIGPDADKSKVDALFSKIDTNGDGSVSQGEMQSAIQKASGGGGHHHHHHVQGGGGQQGGGDPLQALLSGTAADGTTSQEVSNSDGSTTTTITYSDGTKIEMTTPAEAASESGSSGGSSNPEAMNFGNMLKQLISLQAQFAAPTTNLSV